ncbi:MAG: hypothetical protein Salg2KO_16410 [Salibacteraceae bacterium]
MAVFLSSCSWFDNVDPEPQEENLATYHWEGTLYKGYGEEVWANAPVSLEGQHPQGLAYEVITIDEGTTDANGRFRLEYTIDSTDSKYDEYENGLYEVRFQVGGGYPLMTAPWKVDVERDIAQTDHCKVVCIVSRPINSDVDSLYVSVPLMFKTKKQVGFKPSYLDKGFQIQAVELNENPEVITQYSALTTDWQNSEKDYTQLLYGVTKKEFSKAHAALREDSIPDNFNRIELPFRGFPFTDTVYLEL